MVNYDYSIVQVYGCVHCNHKEMFEEQMRNHLKDKHEITNPTFNIVEEDE